jgi:hypothetical protein
MSDNDYWLREIEVGPWRLSIARDGDRLAIAVRQDGQPDAWRYVSAQQMRDFLEYAFPETEGRDTGSADDPRGLAAGPVSDPKPTAE